MGTPIKEEQKEKEECKMKEECQGSLSLSEFLDRLVSVNKTTKTRLLVILSTLKRLTIRDIFRKIYWPLQSENFG